MSTPAARHIFVCTNRKPNGKGCAAFGSEEAFEYLKAQMETKAPLFKNKARVKVVKTSCLGRCKLGPNLYITPDDVWYSFQSLEEIDAIIDKHFT